MCPTFSVATWGCPSGIARRGQYRCRRRAARRSRFPVILIRDMIAGVGDTTERDRWHFGDRWYAVTMAGVSDPDHDGMALELDDVGPPPGRGLVLEVFRDGRTHDMTLISHTTEPLPLLLVEQFITEARRSFRPTKQ